MSRPIPPLSLSWWYGLLSQYKFKLRGGRHHICNGDLQAPTSPAYSALRDPGSAGVWNGTQDSEKVQVSGRVSRLVLFRGEVGLETGGHCRAGRLSGNFPLGVRLRWPRRATRPPASKLDSCSFVATPNRASEPAILSESSRIHARTAPRSRM